MTSMEDRAAINDLPLYTLADVRVGLLDAEWTKVVVIPRAAYVDLATEAIREYYLPDNVRAELLDTARTADRFAVGAWIESRGCGCLVGEYLIAHSAIDEHNDALAQRLMLADDLIVSDIRRCLHEHHSADVTRFLIDIGYRMNTAVEDHLFDHGITLDRGTVFIRDEDERL